MSREIKFRLIKDDKVVGYEMFLDGRWVYAYLNENFNLHTPYIKHDSKNQYTGLKDKNGVEICEGDVLKTEVVIGDCEYINPRKTYIRTIEYKNIKVSSMDGCFVLDSDYIPDDAKMIWVWNDLEVIGSIYENKGMKNVTNE